MCKCHNIWCTAAHSRWVCCEASTADKQSSFSELEVWLSLDLLPKHAVWPGPDSIKCRGKGVVVIQFLINTSSDSLVILKSTFQFIALLEPAPAASHYQDDEHEAAAAQAGTLIAAQQCERKYVSVAFVQGHLTNGTTGLTEAAQLCCVPPQSVLITLPLAPKSPHENSSPRIMPESQTLLPNIQLAFETLTSATRGSPRGNGMSLCTKFLINS